MPQKFDSDVQIIKVENLDFSPTIDGVLDEWENQDWHTVPVKKAMVNDPKNYSGELMVEVKAGISDQKIYFAIRWDDEKEDLEYKNWVWQFNKYRRDKKQDDMFAIRFDKGGDYDTCMITNQDYSVDLWLWSAGRSNIQGLAEDMSQVLSTSLLENAAEYKNLEGNTIYIKKYKDNGSPLYKNRKIKRKNKTDDKLLSIEFPNAPTGSIADVKAKGQWQEGNWSLEMVRNLDTGHEDDVNLNEIKGIKGAIAVFNRAASEHKSNSGTLYFDFSCCLKSETAQ